ncbi:MAG: hypothetical protein CMO98_10310 [Woeseia sp.]|mgnify:FL=1|nr:hypothetical protein [Woeseia sp.]|tara:strand:- start:488 stop:748 length:261 start_codon:yes stop_codon:yes gene_type:complete
MNFAFYDAVGVVGTAMIIIAFFMNVVERMDSGSIGYNALNAVGAGLIIFSLYYDFNWSAFLLELFWLLISGLGLARNLLKKRESTS